MDKRKLPGPPPGFKPATLHTERGKDGRFIEATSVIFISNCCDAEMDVEGLRTKWYMCRNCGKPCNPKRKKR